MEWIDIKTNEPKEAGWYAAAVNPVNHDNKNPKESNSWRESFGFTKVWFNPMAVRKWWEPDPHGMKTQPIDERVTHWGFLPKVPLY